MAAEQDALITVEEDELITAETTNANNRYLENKISDNATTLTNYLERELTRVENELEGEITSAQTTLQQRINELSSIVNAINFMPDYSRRWYASAGTWYTADKDCWLHLQTGSIDDRSDPYLDVQYNGVTERFQSAGSTTATEHFYYCVTSVVPKGGRFQYYAGNSGATLSVIPCVGG